jgi:hypothetical protein
MRECPHENIEWGYISLHPEGTFSFGTCEDCGSPVEERDGRFFVPEHEIFPYEEVL